MDAATKRNIFKDQEMYDHSLVHKNNLCSLVGPYAADYVEKTLRNLTRSRLLLTPTLLMTKLLIQM